MFETSNSMLNEDDRLSFLNELLKQPNSEAKLIFLKNTVIWKKFCKDYPDSTIAKINNEVKPGLILNNIRILHVANFFGINPILLASSSDIVFYSNLNFKGCTIESIRLFSDLRVEFSMEQSGSYTLDRRYVKQFINLCNKYPLNYEYGKTEFWKVNDLFSSKSVVGVRYI